MYESVRNNHDKKVTERLRDLNTFNALHITVE